LCLINENLFIGEDLEFVFRVILHSDRFCLIDNYQYIWYEGEDNIHNFKKSVFNFRTFKKLNCNIQWRIKAFNAIKKGVLQSKRIKNKKECIRAVNQRIELFSHRLKYKKYEWMKDVYWKLIIFIETKYSNKYLKKLMQKFKYLLYDKIIKVI
jgi:hypothetical protein